MPQIFAEKTFRTEKAEQSEVVEEKKVKENNKAIRLYLLLLFTVCYGLGIIELLTNTGKAYEFLRIGFTFFSVLSELITKRVTNVKSHYFVYLRVWKNKKAWLLSAIIPGILIVLGSLAYFFVFKYEYSGIFAYGQLLGNGNTITINNVFVFSFVCIFVAAFLIPIQLLELGEEIGWRGYLLDLQIEKCGERSAVLINGFEWGLAHLPLIYFGFNYSL